MVAVGACGTEGRYPIMILDARGEPGRTDVALFPVSCSQSPVAEVIAENDKTVTVEVQAFETTKPTVATVSPSASMSPWAIVCWSTHPRT